MAHAVNLVLLAALFGYSFAVFDDLPERFPVHFDAAGNPDRFEPKSWGGWLLLPLTSLATTSLFYAITLLLRAAQRSANPWWLNVPKKDLFLRLSPAGRGKILGSLAAMLYWTPVPLNANFFALQWMSGRIAMGHASTLPLLFLPVTLVGVIGVTIWWTLSVRGRIVRAAASEGLDERAPG